MDAGLMGCNFIKGVIHVVYLKVFYFFSHTLFIQINQFSFIY